MQYGWRDCPATVRRQVETLTKGLNQSLKPMLVGIYLHGSLPFGSFNPALSDIDLLVIVGRRLPMEQKQEVARLLLTVSRQPCPVEMTVITEAALHSGAYPMAFDFHYSERWREKIAGQAEAMDGEESEQTDTDLVGQVAITARHGIVLAGEPIKRVLPDLPQEQILASFDRDREDALNAIEENPVYGVLNPCRTLYFQANERFCSKDEAGVWAMETLPSSVHPLIAQALAVYRGDSDAIRFESERLREFAGVVREQGGGALVAREDPPADPARTDKDERRSQS